MKKIAFFDTKPYDKIYFDKFKDEFGFEIKYFESKLNPDTAYIAGKYDAVCAFVNDDLGKDTVNELYDNGINIVAMRCAGYNNVDFKEAYGKVHVVRVPAYSPYAVAEHTMALLLCLNRKIHRAFNRTREYNLSLNSLIGFDLNQKTIGVVGTGKIGRTFINICKRFGLNVIAYDAFPQKNTDINYVTLDELFEKSDIISLHCPLTKETHHMINEKSIEKMKKGVYILNTSRGSLIDSEALLNALKSKKIGAAGLDVYEEETEFFYEDFSYKIINDDILSGLIAMPNVIITSHQAFLTHEALKNIAYVTLSNLSRYFNDEFLENEICYKCQKYGKCDREKEKRCF